MKRSNRPVLLLGVALAVVAFVGVLARQLVDRFGVLPPLPVQP